MKISALPAIFFLVSMSPMTSLGGPAELIEETGITGGLISHLGCGTGEQTLALRTNERFLVHGLDRNAGAIENARARIRAAGAYGPVTVETLEGKRLPYVDNLVNVLVVDDPLGIDRAEMTRVVRPLGSILLKEGAGWKRVVKSWPGEIDDWTHYLHGPGNNAVGRDRVAGPPRRFQWIGGPRWARSHDHLSSFSAMVSARGRLFAIVDEAPIASVALDPDWQLVARDAFNGAVLWKKPLGEWEGHLRGFRSGPTELARRLVAVGDRVYVTLGYGETVTALDAATGAVLRTFAQTENTLEIIAWENVLFLVAGDRPPDNLRKDQRFAEPADFWHWWPVYEETMPRKRLLAVDAESGELRWQKDDADTREVMPTTLAAADGRIFFQNHAEVIALDAATGDLAWRAPRPVNRHRPSWSAPTLVAIDGVVICADRAVDVAPAGAPESDAPSRWLVNSQGGHAPEGEMIAFDAKTGDRLWQAVCKEVYNAPVDVLVSGGRVWSGQLVHRNEPGITRAVDLRTGMEVFQRSPDQDSFPITMGHHRCYRNKATVNYLVLGRDGIEFIDQETGHGAGHPWVRGACQYGVVPCNGLIYAPPHSCACHIESKLNGFLALASGSDEQAEPVNGIPRLVKGPAYSEASAPRPDAARGEDWPVYRRDGARSGRAQTEVPADLRPLWNASLGGPLTAPVVAADRCLVSRLDEQTVYALDPRKGAVVWSHVAGGIVDSPPAVWEDRVYFGSQDGRITCLRASDGALVWAFRAVAEDRRILDNGVLASAWPVPGSVLVRDGTVYAVAGRCAHLDGGMKLLRLNAATGELVGETGLHENALPDILSCDEDSVFLRHRRFNLDGEPVAAPKPHLYSSAGFLDDSWWHRTYWQFGTEMRSAWGGWPVSGNKTPAGRILVMDDDSVYGFGRLNQYHRDGSHVGLGAMQYFLFASAKNPTVERKDGVPAAKKRAAAEGFRIQPRWSTKIDILVQAMVLSGDILFVAGPPDRFVAGEEGDDRGPYFNPSREAAQEQARALAGKEGGIMTAVSAKDGAVLARWEIESVPAWDGLAAAHRRLYLATKAGALLCYGASVKGGRP